MDSGENIVIVERRDIVKQIQRQWENMDIRKKNRNSGRKYGDNGTKYIAEKRMILEKQIDKKS